MFANVHDWINLCATEEVALSQFPGKRFQQSWPHQDQICLRYFATSCCALVSLLVARLWSSFSSIHPEIFFAVEWSFILRIDWPLWQVFYHRQLCSSLVNFLRNQYAESLFGWLYLVTTGIQRFECSRFITEKVAICEVFDGISYVQMHETKLEMFGGKFSVFNLKFGNFSIWLEVETECQCGQDVDVVVSSLLVVALGI